MTPDIFAIQVSSVASERAFSASRRVLDDRRTRLKPETLEMCVYFKDWLDAEDHCKDKSYEQKMIVKPTHLLQDLIALYLFS